MLKKNLPVILFFLFVTGCTTCKGVKTAPAGGEPPVISDSYAPKSVRPGASWRVYLKAQDVDGDMKDIAAVLWQAGVGYYSTSVTLIRGEDRKDFAGYLFLTTPADSSLMWDEFKLTVLVRDCQGNKSESIDLPMRFDLASTEKLPGEWQMAANHRLGAIMIDIESSQRFNSGGRIMEP
jgi:hypothetical protein